MFFGQPYPPTRRRRRRTFQWYPLCVWLVLTALCAAVLILVILWWYPGHTQEPAQEEDTTLIYAAQDGAALASMEQDSEVPVPDVQPPEWVTASLLPVNEYSRPGTPLSQVNGVVVHYVGNPGTTAEQNRSFYANLAETHETWASSHFVIGMDGTIIQCVPLDEVAYCSNDRNDDTISIECCHPDDTGAFTPATQDALEKLLNWLVDTYSLDREDILRHYDVTGKECPLYYVKHPDAWEDLLDKLNFS